VAALGMVVAMGAYIEAIVVTLIIILVLEFKFLGLSPQHFLKKK
ncbi:TPA: MgtC/SapB family protein, partial [Candidatus Woesearchaeota archaeon]|nr:MgtC/SapB family protein [Candidatus Woesearchaeota archaeon]